MSMDARTNLDYNVQHGYDLNVYLTYPGVSRLPIAAGRSCTLRVSRNMIKSVDPDAGGWNNYLPGRAGWTVSVDCLLTWHAQTLGEFLLESTPLWVVWRGEEVSHEYIGVAYIETMTQTGKVKELATFQMSLRGRGNLEVREY